LLLLQRNKCDVSLTLALCWCSSSSIEASLAPTSTEELQKSRILLPDWVWSYILETLREIFVTSSPLPFGNAALEIEVTSSIAKTMVCIPVEAVHSTSYSWSYPVFRTCRSIHFALLQISYSPLLLAGYAMCAVSGFLLRYETFLEPFWHVSFMSVVALCDFSAAVGLYFYTRNHIWSACSKEALTSRRDAAITWILTAGFACNYAAFATFFATLRPEWPTDSVDEIGHNM
jgi:hypothetical protein